MPGAGQVAFVTGATGFIGRALVSRLIGEGWRVKALVRRSSIVPTSWHGQVELSYGDIRDVGICVAAAADANCIFHLAATVHDLAASGDDVRQESTTLTGTRNALDAAIAVHADRFIFASSLAVYGESVGVRDEHDECRPTTAYGRAKLAAERLVAATPGFRINWTILRPAMVYGVGAPGNLSLLARLVRARVLPPLPRETGRRSMIGVHDVVQAACLAASSDYSGGSTFNVTDGQPMSIREVQDAIRCCIGREPHEWAVPISAIRAGARFADGLSLLRGRTKGLILDWTERMLKQAEFDSTRIERELGFRPTTSLRRELPAIISATLPR